MMSDFNILSALGPSAGPGAAASAAPGEAAPGDGTCAAMMDNAAAAGGDGATEVVSDADAAADEALDPDADGEAAPIADPLAMSEWWRFGAVTRHSSCGANEDAAAEGDKSSEDEEADPADVPVAGMMNINWLLGQPVARQPWAISMQSGDGNGGTDAAPTDESSSVEGGEFQQRVFGRTWNTMATIEGKAAAPAQPANADAAQPDLAATVDALVADAAAQVPADGATEAAATPENQTAAKPAVAQANRPKATSGKIDIEAATAQQRAAAAMIEATAAAAPSGGPAVPDVAQTPQATRPEPAAARLARSIEQSGGATIDAAVTAPVAQGFESLGDAAQDGTSSGFASSSGEPAPMPEPVRVASNAAGTPVFVVPHTTTASVMAAVGAPVGAEVAQSGIPLRDTEMVQQFVQTMRVQFRDGIGDAVLRLRPEHLGEVSISLRVENGSVAATVNAETAAVRQWLEANQASLRQGLSEQGLQLDRFVVQRDPQERHSRDEESSPRRQQQQRRRNANADTPRFEITV